MIPDIRGYAIMDTLHDGPKTSVFRGIRMADGVRVIIKTCKSTDGTHKLRRSYDLLFGKNIEGSPEVLDMVFFDEQAALITRDVGAESLDVWLMENGVDERVFVTIAKNAACALADVHAAGILHRDIKPANIIVDPITLRTWIIDFGASCQVGRQAPEGVEGTVEFISPEQTGRIYGTVDERSDLYSLGITFYYMLTGRLPFTGETPLAVIHGHIALMPSPPIESAKVNEITSNLIMKLIQKAPASRYPSADSLMADLSRIELALKNTDADTIEPFQLGESHLLDAFEMQGKLYGKDRLMKSLWDCYERVTKGRAELVILRGASGTGKTTLMREFQRRCEAGGAHVCVARYEESSRNDPHYAFREGFARFYKRFEEKVGDLEPFRVKLRDALGDKAFALQGIIPDADVVCKGMKEPTTKFGVAESMARKEQAFLGLAKSLVSPSFPGVYVCENMQWADYINFKFSMELLEERSLKNLLIVWVIRDGYESNTSLSQAVRETLDMSCDLTTLRTGCFDSKTTREAVSDVLRTGRNTSPSEIDLLANYLFDATGGRPAQVRMFMQALYEQSYFTYDTPKDCWNWNLEAIKGAEIIIDLGEAFKRRMQMLKPDMKNVAVFLSFVGTEITRERVRVYSGGQIDDVLLTDVMVFLRASGVFTYDARMESWSYTSRGMIRQFRALATPEEQAATHLKIGRNMLEAYKAHPHEMELYCAEITDHFNESGLVEPGNQDALFIAQLNLDAGDRALEGGAQNHALRYYQTGMKLLGDKPFEASYTLAFQLYLNATDALSKPDTQENRDAAAGYFDMLKENAKGDEDMFSLCCKRIMQLESAFDSVGVIKFSIEYLTGKGVLASEKYKGIMPDYAVRREREIFQKNLQNREMDECLTGHMATDRHARHLGPIMSMLTIALYNETDSAYEYMLYSTFNLMYSYGSFERFESCLLIWAVLNAENGNLAEAEQMISRCLSFCEHINIEKSNVYYYYGSLVSHWLHPLAMTADIYKMAKIAGQSEGAVYISSSVDCIALDLHAYQGMELNIYTREVDNAVEAARKAGHEACAQRYSCVHLQYAKCLLGKTKGTDSFDDKNFVESKFLERNKDNRTLLGYYYMYKVQALSLHRHYDKAVAEFERFEQYGSAVRLTLPYVSTLFYYTLALSRLIAEEPDENGRYVPVMRAMQLQFSKWSGVCPENFKHKQLLLEAEIRRIKDNDVAVLTLYGEARKLATEGRYQLDLALLDECVHEYWKSHKVVEYLDHHKKEARRVYTEIGARPKAWQFTYEDEYSLMQAKQMGSMISLSSPSSVGGSIYQGGGEDQLGGLGYKQLLGLTQMLSGDLDLARRADKFLNMLVQHSGGRRGFVVLLRDEVPVVYAAYYAEGGTDRIPAAQLPLPLSEVPPLMAPVMVFHTVLEKRAGVAINRHVDAYMFNNDAYINDRAPESFACLPILTGGKAHGVAYLEHARLGGVFTDEQMSIASTIVTQSAPFIENAVYYDEMSNYAKTVEHRLQEHIGSLNTLIAGIAHEINSPVGVCVTVSSRQKEAQAEVRAKFDEGKLGKSALASFFEEDAKGTDIIFNNSTRAASLVQNFKKMSVDQSNEVFEWTDLPALIRNIVEYVRPAVKNQIGSIEITAPETLQVFTCTGSLTQVFTNMVMNAAIHAFENIPKADCFVTIKVEQAGGNVQIVFTDNGKGMTDEELEKLWQPFYTTKRNKGGSGLGTHIILTLITQTLGGNIKCVSKPGKGTSYIITLPVEKGKQ